MRIALFLVLTFGFNTYGQVDFETSDAFIAEFMQAVNMHDGKKVISMMDKSYRKKQLRFLKGRKNQFLDELFSGYKGETYYNTTFNEIYECVLSEFTENEDGSLTCYFIIVENFTEGEEPEEIYMDLLLVYNKGKLGFVGASG